MRRKVLSIFLVFLLALPLCIRIRASGLEWTALAELLDAAPDGLLQSNALTPGDSLSDWVAILAGRSGETGGAEAYLEKLWKEVSRRYEQTGGLDVVYGGGLKADNAAMLASIADIDGGLIALTRFSGEIGFYPEEYLEIIRLYLGH